jgi:hypothetical protein
MAHTVFSKRFITAAGVSGTGPSVTVPAGHVYVVKQVTMYMDPSFGIIRAFFQDDASGAALFSEGTNIGTPLWAGLFGSLVFEPGDAFHFQVNGFLGDSVDCYAGGYDLLLP